MSANVLDNRVDLSGNKVRWKLEDLSDLSGILSSDRGDDRYPVNPVGGKSLEIRLNSSASP
jgi:hypothetical protein